MSFSSKIIHWYQENGRSLPWRGIDNPYYIWLSEIILQQTRIEQGRDYYDRFIHEYPSVCDLAAASEEQILKSWQGLGYYSRARNLHEAARTIMEKYHGNFPNTYSEIRNLKGIGPYTAAAIASFAFKLPYPVIDGNVYRLITRLYGIYTPVPSTTAYNEIEQLLKGLIDKERPDSFNQAVMDFGSIMCRPTNPSCLECPFQNECVALHDDKVALLPVKAASVKVRTRYFYYLDMVWHDKKEQHSWMQRRGSGDIWQGLYEFPLIESEAPWNEKELQTNTTDYFAKYFTTPPSTTTVSNTITHKLTHQTIEARFVYAFFESKPIANPENTIQIKQSDLKTLPVSRLIDRYLSKK